MNFRYSCFISYRRHQDDSRFMQKLKNMIEVEAFKVTNKQDVFFDQQNIKWGEEFDDKIYEGIVSSYFFIPLYHNVYLHEDNLWCAKELHWAIQLEHKIRETISTYCFILPLIDRGSASDFPECIGRKNAKEIKKFRHFIVGNGTSKAFEDFKNEIYDVLLQNYQLIKEGHSFIAYLNDLEPISNEKLKEWIRQQEIRDKDVSASQLPILTKNVF
jgi:hypothetical protein